MKQVKNRPFSLRFALATSVALFGSSAALAQSTDDDIGNSSYYGLEYVNSKSTSGFDVGNVDRGDSGDDVESTDAGFVWMTAPGLGAKGFSGGFRYTIRAGVEDEADANIYIEVDGAPGFQQGSTAADDFGFNGELTYEENYRASAAYSFYYSFAERYHPYFTTGVYYVDVDASMEGTVDGGACNGSPVDVSEIGTTGGFVYGIGMLVNFTKNLALTLAYESTDNLDSDFDVICGGETFTVASFDSRIESYSLGLAYSF